MPQSFPPQSTSVSPPLRTRSVQLDEHTPDAHAPLWQSVGAPHEAPSAQRGQARVPPQSTSVSPPLRTPSKQVGVMHRRELHTELSQSLRAMQAWPVAHERHHSGVGVGFEAAQSFLDAVAA